MGDDGITDVAETDAEGDDDKDDNGRFAVIAVRGEQEEAAVSPFDTGNELKDDEEDEEDADRTGLMLSVVEEGGGRGAAEDVMGKGKGKGSPAPPLAAVA